MEAPEQEREEKPNIKKEIKQENEIYSNAPPDEDCDVKVDPWIIDLNKVKIEPEIVDTEHEASYYITPNDFRELAKIKTEPTNVKIEPADVKIEPADIKTEPAEENENEGDEDDEDDGNDSDTLTVRRKRKRITRGVDKPCPYCEKTFRDSYKLRKHIMDHTGERPFKCEMCESTFKEKYNLTQHTKTHTGERKISCPECDKTFIVPSALKAHMRTHSKEKPYVCNICGRGFSHSANLKPHMSTHSEEFPFHCLECGKSFRMRKGLLRHLRGHHANCTKEGCEFCAQFNKVKLKPRKYVKVPEKLRECPICLQTFRYYMTYKNHMRAHNNENYTCSFCGKSYLDRSALRVHLRNHTGETPYVCNVCGKKFKRGDSYRYHISTHNETRKLFHCDICNQDYTHRSSLLKHKRHVHDDERPFQCEICERSFKTPQVLNGHLRTHKGNPHRLPAPEVCKICKKTVDKRGYKAHMKKHGIETFKCKKCRGVFEGQETFEAHTRAGCKRYKTVKPDMAVGSLSPAAVVPEVKLEVEGNEEEMENSERERGVKESDNGEEAETGA